MAKRYWDDLKEGERLSCRPVVFEKKEIISFAKKYDPQPFHVNEEIAKKSIFGGLIASALHTISACTRVVVEGQGDLAIMSGLGIDEVKVFNPLGPLDLHLPDLAFKDLQGLFVSPVPAHEQIKKLVGIVINLLELFDRI